MKQYCFAICDTEQDYARRLLQMLRIDKHFDYQMHLFQGLKQLQEFAKENPPQIVLMSEEYPREERLKIPAKIRFLLTESEAEKSEDAEQGDQIGAAGEAECRICRYQSAEEIRQQIRQKLGSPGISVKEKQIQSAPAALSVAAEDTGIIGIYSPVHRIGKTRFALGLGQTMSEKAPALYLNLEGYAGGNFYFSDPPEQNMGDLLYYLRQERQNLGLRISTMTGQIGSLDYILPMTTQQDLREVPGKEWLRLLERIQRECIYETILLDLGDGIDGLFSILAACDKVYVPYIRDGAAQAKLQEYEEELRRTGYESVLEHSVKYRVQGQLLDFLGKIKGEGEIP